MEIIKTLNKYHASRWISQIVTLNASKNDQSCGVLKHAMQNNDENKRYPKA